MPDSLPQYESPPVVEVVLGVQFAPIAGFSTAHAGWFWKSKLPPDWTTVREAPRLDDQFERFGDEVIWGQLGLMLRPGGDPERVQIVRSDEQRMIQIQNTRFVYNWKKRENSPYPSFNKLLPEFRETWRHYQEFASEAEFGSLAPNQWEVIYVNHIPAGDLWKPGSDWSRILPAARMPFEPIEGTSFESTRECSWSYTLGTNYGRLHVTAKHGKLQAGGIEAVIVQLVARGPIRPESGLSLEAGLELGHASVVTSFTAMTSDEAHRHWGGELNGG